MLDNISFTFFAPFSSFHLFSRRLFFLIHSETRLYKTKTKKKGKKKKKKKKKEKRKKMNKINEARIRKKKERKTENSSVSSSRCFLLITEL